MTPTNGMTNATAAENITQLSPAAIIGVWAAATAPMGIGAWVIAPQIKDSLGDQGLLKALVITLTAGLVWQFVLAVTLVAIEQRSARWSTVREALWLRAPRNAKTGRRGGRLWWIVVPFVFLFAAGEMVPSLPHPDARDFGVIIESDAGQAFLSGNWKWFVIVMVMFIFNTMLGEELLFRGYLLPRMEGAFGDKAWVANGVLFGLYHVHVPWVIPAVLLIDTFALAYSSQRYRSAWIGIIVHSAQTLVLGGLLLALVLK